MLRDCDQEMLVAYIWYNEEAEKGNFTRISTIFTESDSNNTIKKKIIASRKDSIKIIKNKWTLLKKGKLVQNDNLMLMILIGISKEINKKKQKTSLVFGIVDRM